jgi:hypothetical protein
MVITGEQGVAGERLSASTLKGKDSAAPLYGFRLPDIDGRLVDQQDLQGKGPVDREYGESVWEYSTIRRPPRIV